MDFCHLRQAEGADKITVFHQKDRDSKTIRSQIIEPKGVKCVERGEKFQSTESADGAAAASRSGLWHASMSPTVASNLGSRRSRGFSECTSFPLERKVDAPLVD